MAGPRNTMEAIMDHASRGEDPSGNRRALLVDAAGRLRVATGPAALFDKSLAVVTSKLIFTQPCYLVRVVVTNVNAAVRYFNIHDKATAPVATDIPALQGISLPVPAGTANNPGAVTVELGETHRLDFGLGWSISTAVNVFTDSATATEHTVHLWYTTLTPKD